MVRFSCRQHFLDMFPEAQVAPLVTQATGAPNLDVRLTRSQSGSILDIDFVGGALPVTDGEKRGLVHPIVICTSFS